MARRRCAAPRERLTRTHLGETLLTWLVNVGLALATGLAVIMGVLGVLVLLFGVGAVLYATDGA
jgi:hypothetical protein